MTDIIKALEKLGESGSLDKNELQQLGEEAMHAIQNKDEKALIQLLDLAPEIICFLAPAEDDEKEKEGDSEPSQDEKIALRS